MQMTGNSILITGGTSGIGRGLAEAFHRLGNQVIIAGRRQSRLDEMIEANPGMIGFQLDVQDPAAIDAFAARVREKIPELNVLVNNAGISRPENLTADSDLSIARNIIGVLHMTTTLFAALTAKPQATIITTTSGLAFVPRNNFPPLERVASIPSHILLLRRSCDILRSGRGHRFGQELELWHRRFGRHICAVGS
jgi:uncharacterized oxidoreductase